ncbi:MAG: hypothetical protein ACYDDU_10510 [Dermatophilaceae bacterium]
MSAAASKSNPGPDRRPPAAADAVVKVLRGVAQGDLVSLGAVTLVGVGTSAAWSSTAEHEGLPAGGDDELWSLTVESDVGWYAVITQDCDIARDPGTEPALVVCPLRFVPDGAWQALRSGPTSPREFPYPGGSGLPAREGHKLVADLRFVTSVDKTALLHPSVQFKQPLSGPQRTAFGRWVGSRYARAPHPDVLERDVLPKAARVVRRLAARFAAGQSADPEVRLVGATECWYLGGNDKRVLFIPMLSEASARAAKLWLGQSSEFDNATILAAAKRLTNQLRAGLPVGGGYTCAVEPATLHGTSAADLLEWSEWIIE